jgi:hypothetical protein
MRARTFHVHRCPCWHRVDTGSIPLGRGIDTGLWDTGSSEAPGLDESEAIEMYNRTTTNQQHTTFGPRRHIAAVAIIAATSAVGLGMPAWAAAAAPEPTPSGITKSGNSKRRRGLSAIMWRDLGPGAARGRSVA